MAKSPKRTASFKYCSRKRKPGCRKASKRCSYRKSRTPSCQPKKSKKVSKKTSKKTKRKSAKKTLENAKKFPKTGVRQPKSLKYKTCASKKSKTSCRPEKTLKNGKTRPGSDPKLECAWDPKKNPKCGTKAPSIFDLSVEFHSAKDNIHFSYPITREGVAKGHFVVHTVGDKNKLYLKYSRELLDTMKPKHAKALKLWWCSYGETIYTKRLTEDKDDDVARRIGVAKTLTEPQYTEFTNVDPADSSDGGSDTDSDASGPSSGIAGMARKVGSALGISSSDSTQKADSSDTTKKQSPPSRQSTRKKTQPDWLRQRAEDEVSISDAPYSLQIM